jgi:hypothetical protein
MIDLFRNHLLAALAALPVLCGMAHQVHDRFAMHHHCVEMEACCEHHEGDEPSAPGHDSKGCDHALCCHSIVALVDSPAPALIRAWIAGSNVPDLFLHPPGVEPGDIEHPPQLA